MRNFSNPGRAAWLVGAVFVAACGGSASVDVEFHATASTSSSATSGSSSAPRANGAGTTTTAPRSSGAETTTVATPPPDRLAVPTQPTVVEPPADTTVYIRLEAPSTLDAELDRDLLRVAEEHIRMRVDAMPGVAVAPPGEPIEVGSALISRRGIHGATLQCSLRRVGAGPQGLRATVSFLVTRFSSTDLLGAFDGGALVPGAPAADTPRVAVRGAVDSALRGLPQVLERAPSNR